MTSTLPINIGLPDGFLNKEMRCGYEVSEKLKKIWAVEIDLLREFKRVCDKYGIKYTIFGGTMLGAVRHKGFIPWDDDLDVALTREEFDRLCKIAPCEFKYPYFFQTALTDQRYFCAYARLRNSETTGAIAWMATDNYNNGIYIDIYVLEGYFDSTFMWSFQNRLLRYAIKPLNLYYRDLPSLTKSTKGRMVMIVKPFLNSFPYSFWVSIYMRILKMATKYTSRIGLRDEISEAAKRYWIYKDEFKEIVEIDFEWLKVSVIKNYAEVLCRIYGNYMEFPPASERGKWHEGMIRFDPDVPYKEYLKNMQN